MMAPKCSPLPQRCLSRRSWPLGFPKVLEWRVGAPAGRICQLRNHMCILVQYTGEPEIAVHSIAVEENERYFIRSSALPDSMPTAERSAKYVQAR